jgi:predicted peptidase
MRILQTSLKDKKKDASLQAIAWVTKFEGMNTTHLMHLAAGKHHEVDLPLPTGLTIGFMIWIPYTFTEQSSWPLIWFLHGGAEGAREGNTISSVANHGLPHKIAHNQLVSDRFVVISPQCPGASWIGNIEHLTALHAAVMDQMPMLDRERCYLTGLSMGGFGTWRWAAAEPQLFSAIVPICGGWSAKSDDDKSASSIEALKQSRMWICHGANDVVVPVEFSDELAAQLEKSDERRYRYSRYKSCPAPFQPTDSSQNRDEKLTGHDSWSETYSNPELYEWLLNEEKSTIFKRPGL